MMMMMMMKKMKPVTLLLNLSIFFILTLSASSKDFKCNSTSTCESLIDYVLPNSTTLSEITTLFGVKNLRYLLGANSLPLNTPSTKSIPAKQKIKIPFPCLCINGTGISNKKPLYKIKKDDGLDHIARDIFAELVTYQQIAAVNNIPNPDLIETGAELWIPLPCSCDSLNGSRVVHYGHVVEKGSSVKQIAEKYGTTEDTLLTLNGISDPNTLQAGAVLDVPLRACSSQIRNTSLDYPLLVSNGTYTFTANNCVQCKCESSNNWTLRCEPSPKDEVKVHNWSQCPSMQCQGSDNLSLGNISSPASICDRKVCSYAGYTNQTIFTTVVNESSCLVGGGPQTPNLKNNVSKIGLQGSRCWWLVISLSLSLLLSGLLL